MPTLLVEILGRRMIADLSRRVIIGRAAGSEIHVEDRSVSRIHAWISREGETFYITDAGSRFGSRINGRLFHGRVVLNDGDQIRIGPAKLRFREKTTIPPGFEPIDLNEAASQRSAELVDCVCGAPLWTPWDYAGQMGVCRYCGNRADGTASLPSSIATVATAEVSIGSCGACHSDIVVGEATTSCPDCGVTFHANCWAENLGCSSYGCKQVGILDPEQHTLSASAMESVSEAGPELDTPSGGRSVDWSYPMLAAALGSGLAGLLAFGVPPAICLIVLIVYHFRTTARPRRTLFAVSTLITLIAIGAGVAFSWYWWLAGRTGARIALL